MDTQIPDNWSTTEKGKGNVWFSDEGRHVIWIVLPDGRRMEIFVDPNKRPGLNVRVLSKEDSHDAKIAAWIKGNLSCWRHHASDLPNQPPEQIFDSLY
jgi:hypothetical protein